MGFKKEFIFGFSFLAFAFYANAEKMPEDLSKAILEKNVGSEILVSKSCQLGSSNTPAIGFLLKRTDNKNPLTIHMAVLREKNWNLFVIPTDVSHARGASSNILSEFWDEKIGLINISYDIFCTALPNSKEFIGKKHKGIFDKPFTEKTQRGQKHLCFAASAMYNSYVCYGFDEENSQPQRIFTQFNSD